MQSKQYNTESDWSQYDTTYTLSIVLTSNIVSSSAKKWSCAEYPPRKSALKVQYFHATNLI